MGQELEPPGGLLYLGAHPRQVAFDLEKVIDGISTAQEFKQAGFFLAHDAEASF